MELAGEIAVDFPDKKVILVHRGPKLLEFVGSRASQIALDWLTSKKVEVILNQSVTLNTIPDGRIETSSGETINADCHFMCTGKAMASSWLRETILKDSLDSRGRLMVYENLRVRGFKNVFAIGDITDIPVSPFNIFPSLFCSFCLTQHTVKDFIIRTGGIRG